MQLREFDYSSVQTARKRCIQYAKDGNTVVKHWLGLYPLEVITGCREFSNLFLEYYKKGYSEYFRIYNDLGTDCVEYGYLSGWYGVTEEAIEHLKEYVPFIGLEGYKLWLAKMEQTGSWINNAMIRGLADAGELELAEHYKEYHDKKARERDEKEKARRAEFERERQEKERKHQAELEEQVLDAERCILDRKELANVPYEGSTIILHLMKKHGIIPPLRTQGWINEKLLKVIIRDDSLSLTYAKTKKCKASRTVVDYLVQLRDKIDQAYSNSKSA